MRRRWASVQTMKSLFLQRSHSSQSSLRRTALRSLLRCRFALLDGLTSLCSLLLQAFKGPALPPVAFREVFYRVFLVRLTFPEIGALMSVLDEGGTGTIDGNQFMNSFFRLGRLQEKALLGESTSTLTSLDCLKSASEPHSAETFQSSTPSITKRQQPATASANGPPRSPEDFRHSSIQATDEDISQFTEVTLGQSWVLPTTVKSRSVSTLSPSVSSKKQIPEQNFDDFEPFILVPRSPDAKVRYHPNLKDFPMPSAGPPVGKKPNLAFNLSQNKTASKKGNSKHSASAPIEFQAISLKKTATASTRAENAPLKSGTPTESSSRPLTADAMTNPATNTSTGTKILKTQKVKRSQKEPSAPFFFPALLSTAPHLNLAPVGGDRVQQENVLLYENTETF
jgi:hypothetical protein